MIIRIEVYEAVSEEKKAELRKALEALGLKHMTLDSYPGCAPDGEDPVYPDEDGCEYLRTWEHGPFKLVLFDTCRTGFDKSVLAYQFYHDRELIFSGADFGCSPLHAVDSDATVAGILTFLSLRPGDTDADWFADYTSKQMAFAQSHGEELSMLAMEMEEKG